MKALVYQNNHIKLVEKSAPEIQSSSDAIIKVKAASICTSDLHIIHGKVPFAEEGVILGHEFVGEVVEIGDEVKGLKKGDRVAVNCETFCGKCFFCKRGFVNNCINGGWLLGCRIDGGHGEYVRVPYADNCLTKLPENISYEQALFVGDILSSGYWGAELCEIKQEDTVAVIGAGPVGLCAMQCAKLFGAAKVVAIDINSERLKIAKKIADVVINPQADELPLNMDCVIECAGGDNTFEMAWKIARPNAIVALVAMYEKNQILPLPQMYGKNLTFKTGGVDAIHCKKLIELIAQGKLDTDFLITHKFPFEKIEHAYNFFENKIDNCLKIAIIF